MGAYEISILITAGFFIGIIGGLFGIGGGLFSVPLFYFVFGFDMHQSIAASLAAIAASSAVTTATKINSGMVSLRLAKVLEAPSVVGAVFGALVIGALPVNLLKILFCIVGFVMAFNMLRNPFKKAIGRKVKDHFIPENTRGEFADRYREASSGRTVFYEARRVKPASAISFSAGFLSSILGIGGGVINVPLINQFCKCPVKVASATSGYMLGVTAAAASAVYFAKGYIVPDMTLMFVVGVMAGAWLGMNMLIKIKPILVELFFSLLLIATTLKMLLSI